MSGELEPIAADPSEPAAEPSEAPSQDVPDVLQVGQTANYSGMDVTVAGLEPFTPSDTHSATSQGTRRSASP